MSMIINMLGPLVFWLLEKWMTNQEKKKEFQESYFAFLDAVEKSGSTKVANHIAAKKSLKAEQLRILKEKEELKKQQGGE